MAVGGGHGWAAKEWIWLLGREGGREARRIKRECGLVTLKNFVLATDKIRYYLKIFVTNLVTDNISVINLVTDTISVTKS